MILKVATNINTNICILLFYKLTVGISQLIFHHVLNLDLELGVFRRLFFLKFLLVSVHQTYQGHKYSVVVVDSKSPFQTKPTLA